MSQHQYRRCDNCSNVIQDSAHLLLIRAGFAFKVNVTSNDMARDADLCADCFRTLFEKAERKHWGGELAPTDKTLVI